MDQATFLATIFGMGTLLFGAAVFGSLRDGRRLEAAAWFVFGALDLGALGIGLSGGGPKWLVNTLVGLAFLVGAPLAWRDLVDRWRNLGGGRSR
jgi:hypothetical protein